MFSCGKLPVSKLATLAPRTVVSARFRRLRRRQIPSYIFAGHRGGKTICASLFSTHPERTNSASELGGAFRWKTRHGKHNTVNILLVDDERANLLALDAILANSESNLVAAQSGEDALAAAERADFAVILLDIQMRGIDGYETARLLRGRPRTRMTPIIFLTAFDTDL